MTYLALKLWSLSISCIRLPSPSRCFVLYSPSIVVRLRSHAAAVFFRALAASMLSMFEMKMLDIAPRFFGNEYIGTNKLFDENS
jgi:hypothetical protein